MVSSPHRRVSRRPLRRTPHPPRRYASVCASVQKSPIFSRSLAPHPCLTVRPGAPTSRLDLWGCTLVWRTVRNHRRCSVAFWGFGGWHGRLRSYHPRRSRHSSRRPSPVSTAMAQAWRCESGRRGPRPGRCAICGKGPRARLGLGPVHTIGLAEARERARRHRHTLVPFGTYRCVVEATV